MSRKIRLGWLGEYSIYRGLSMTHMRGVIFLGFTKTVMILLGIGYFISYMIIAQESMQKLALVKQKM